MRIYILLVWLMVPVLAGAYHWGPGQQMLAVDNVATLVRQAEQHAADEEWSEAEVQYTSALELLPADDFATERRLRLERAKAQMLNKKLPTAHADV